MVSMARKGLTRGDNSERRCRPRAAVAMMGSIGASLLGIHFRLRLPNISRLRSINFFGLNLRKKD